MATWTRTVTTSYSYTTTYLPTTITRREFRTATTTFSTGYTYRSYETSTTHIPRYMRSSTRHGHLAGAIVCLIIGLTAASIFVFLVVGYVRLERQLDSKLRPPSSEEVQLETLERTELPEIVPEVEHKRTSAPEPHADAPPEYST